MNIDWRRTLRKSIETHYIQNPEQEWFGVIISTNGNLNLTLVSTRFAGMSVQERRDHIIKLLHENDIFIRVGFLSLFTPEQARKMGISKQPQREEEFYDWQDLAIWAANVDFEGAPPIRQSRKPQTVAFYSFKSGVGCTTALIHVAMNLVMRGSKVVVVDLDLKTPGLAAEINLNPLPQYGVVDYFYHHANLPEDVKPEIFLSDILGEISIMNDGQLFVVPTGKLSFDYMAMVDDLHANSITEAGKDLWRTFVDEVNDSLQPDMILVDSSSGLDQWGGFSVLRASEEAVVLLAPNEQNYQGTLLLLDALSTINVPVSIVFSIVPSLDQTGSEKVLKYWQTLRHYKNVKNANDNLPLQIPYLPTVALADHYPVPSVQNDYLPIVNIIDKNKGSMNILNC